MAVIGNAVTFMGEILIPEFSYTGTFTTIDDGNGNWRVKFLPSGTLTFVKRCRIDVFQFEVTEVVQ